MHRYIISRAFIIPVLQTEIFYNTVQGSQAFSPLGRVGLTITVKLQVQQEGGEKRN